MAESSRTSPANDRGAAADEAEVFEAARTLYNMQYKKLDQYAAAELKQLLPQKDAPSSRPPPQNRRRRPHSPPERSPSRGQNKRPRDHPPRTWEFPPEWLRGEVGECCKEPLEKRLHNSDVKDNQNRLCMTKLHVQTHFTPLLKAEERPELGEGVAVAAYDWTGKKYNMKYRIWGDGKNHVLIGGWKNFFHDHKLEAEKDTVTVWMFRHRHTDLLCVLITYKRSTLASS